MIIPLLFYLFFNMLLSNYLLFVTFETAFAILGLSRTSPTTSYVLSIIGYYALPLKQHLQYSVSAAPSIILFNHMISIFGINVPTFELETLYTIFCLEYSFYCRSAGGRTLA